MSRLSVRPRVAAIIAGAALAAFAAFAPAANALTNPRPINPNPYPCVHLVGTPDPCAPSEGPTGPSDHPSPITDPSCLRVDVEPLHCPYLP